eukprot:jgi/Galph1/3866/GphlegSOOS_G2523.1
METKFRSLETTFSRAFCFSLPNGNVLKVEQSPFTSKTCQDPGDTGCTVWDSSLVLAQLLLNKPFWMKDKNVVELGSGVGFLGLVVSSLGAKSVTLTDLPSTLEILNRNVEKHRHGLGNIVSLPLIWGDDQLMQHERLAKDKWIICSDLVYRLEMVGPLVKTLYQLSNLETQILFAQDNHRPEVMTLFERVMKPHFHYTPIPQSWLHPEIQSAAITVRIYQKIDW